MNDIIEYEFSESGLGTSICFLSTMLASNRKIVLYTNKVNNSLFELKKFFQIPDSQFVIQYREHLSNDIIISPTQQLLVSDIIKIFAPYFSVDTVNVLGQSRALKGSGKPCVALMCYNNYESYLQYDPDNSRYPDNRYHALQDYANIFQLIKRAGYEVITLDSADINLEQKIYMLNELCDAVVGYEGGMCHLAHVLKIPAIILPYRYQPGQFRSRWNPYLNLLHLDKRTWFLDTMEQLYRWSPADFKSMITNLYNGCGNNLFRSNELSIQFSENWKRVSISSPESGEISDLPTTDFEYNFYKTYVNDLKLFDDITPNFVNTL
jgi:hypothetical protein